MHLRQSSKEQSERVSGFTLIELLTVIAIIGILAAILIPIVGKARDSAARASDVSNLRQIGMGIHLYADDHESRMPGPYYAPILHSTTGNSTGSGTKVFTNDMAPYLQQDVPNGEQVVIDILVSAMFARMFSEEEIRSGMSYRVNTVDELFGNNSNVALPNPISIDTIENPSVMWMVMDIDQTIYRAGERQIAPAPLYGATRNVLYVDGHVGQAPSNIRPRRGELLLHNSKP